MKHKDVRPQIPSRINIGYQKYKVLRVNEDSIRQDLKGDDAFYYGMCDTTNCYIKINKDLDVEEECNTLIHECLHAVHKAYGIVARRPDEEFIVTALSNGITELFTRNPKFMRYVVECFHPKFLSK